MNPNTYLKCKGETHESTRSTDSIYMRLENRQNEPMLGTAGPWAPDLNRPPVGRH